MDEIVTYLKQCGAFYLATVEGDQPRVRPFGAVCTFEGKLYICTNNQKRVYAQMLSNPKVEISAMAQGGWLRLEAEAIPDHRREARVAMLKDNADSLSGMYTADDNLFEVLYLKNAVASLNTFGKEPRIIRF
ncbi:MAG TPA: pyridoxamine 5'-phosphate oxidase family protein [Candidatus Limiplasma sp.]|nr:pyridoxamine 5'-phosphate oxidase family protein [Candidatus Limiplasma sp.]HPR77693.1 pyridoxamine 5'-phosphate oxidase family protein [Candidatus Limiplasma sp.]